MSELLSWGVWAFVLMYAGVNAIFVLGLQLQVGDTGLVNFGNVAFMLAGAYSMGLMLVHGWPIWAAIPLAMVAGAVVGLLLGIPTLRLRADYFAITTIAAAEILRSIITNEDATTGGTQGLLSASGPWKQFNRDVLGFFEDHFGWELDRNVPLLVLAWLVAIIVAAVLWFVTRQPWGRVLHAVRENEEAAEAVGKPVFRYKLQALALGGAVGALSGVFFTFAATTLYPESFLPIVTFIGFAIRILGGFGSYLGVLIAAVLVGVIVDGSVLLDLPISPEKVAALRYVIIGLLIMALMAFRPQGLLGKKEELNLDA
jgi:branched-chain amino acid transport system permease protein